VQDPAHDAIHLIDSSVHRSKLSAIDAANVITADATHPRKRVAWIYLAPNGTSEATPPDPGSTDKDKEEPASGGASKTSDRSEPPWFAPTRECVMATTNTWSGGDTFAYDVYGKVTGTLPQGKITCKLTYQICSDFFFRQQVIDVEKGERCPQALHFSSVPQRRVCCTEWQEAKRTKNPCDPLVDADCDGAPNDEDDYPLDPAQK